MSKVTVTIERLGDYAVMQVSKENGGNFAVQLTDIKEIINQMVGETELVQMTGTEIPFE